MEQKTYDCVIIGAGLGGLTAGVALAKNKKKVLLLEKHHIPGGCATTFKRVDKKKNLFEFESSLHQIAGLDGTGSVGKLLKEMNLLDKITPVRQEKSYSTVKHHIGANSLEELITNLSETFPKEKDNIEEFFKDLKVLLEVIDGTFDRPMAPSNIHEWNNIRAVDLCNRYFKDKDLIDLLLANYPYYTDDKNAINAFYYFYPEMEYIVHGSWYIEGGSQVLSNTLRDEIVRLGGEVKTLQEVVKANFDSNANKIVSVETKKGEVYHAKEFAFNTSQMQVYKLTEQTQHLNELKDLKYSTSFDGAFVGLDVHPSKVGMTKQEYHVFDKKDKNRGFIISNYTEKDSSKSKDKVGTITVISITTANEWPKPGTDKYKTKKKQIEDQVKRLLMENFKGIDKHITILEGMSPYTIERYTYQDAGAMYGHEQIPNYPERKSETNIKNAFITGVWGDVGGGYEGAMLGGYFTGLRLAKPRSTKKVDLVYNKNLNLINITMVSVAFQLWGLWMFTVFAGMAFDTAEAAQNKIRMAANIGVAMWALAYFTFRKMTKWKHSWKPTLLEMASALIIVGMPMFTMTVGNADNNYGLFFMNYVSADNHGGSLLFFGASMFYALVWIISAFTMPATMEYAKWQMPATVTSRYSFWKINSMIALMWGIIFTITAVGYLFIPEPYSATIYSVIAFGPIIMHKIYKKTIVPMPMKK